MRNYVGYAGSDLRLSGGILTSAMFQSVGAADHSIKFKEIVPVQTDGSLAPSGKILIQYVKHDGGTDRDNIYTWLGGKWLNARFQDASNTVIPAGKGFMAINNCGGSTPISLRSSGEVNREDVEFPLNLTGGVAAANVFPVATTFGRIVPLQNDDTVAPSGKILIQYIKHDGGTDRDNIYTWLGGKWLNARFQDASNTVIPAGQGLYTINNCGGSTAIRLRIPAPEL